MLALIIASVLGTPINEFQGDWCVFEIETRDAGKQDWRGATFARQGGPHWHVQGTLVVSTFSDHSVTKLLSSDPNAFPVGGKNGVRFVDFDGVVFTGIYTLNKDGTAVLKLLGSAPVLGVASAIGTKYINIHLERPKPSTNPSQPGFRP